MRSLAAADVQSKMTRSCLSAPDRGCCAQANEKMARNTFMIYLTPGLGMTMPSQPAQAAAPAREQQQQQQPATAPSPPAAAAVGAA